MSVNEKLHCKKFGLGITPPCLFLVFIAGFVLVFIGSLLLMTGVMFNGGGSSSSFGVVFVGPFPIIFGESSYTDCVVVGSLIIGALILLAFIFMCRKGKS